MNDEVRYSKLYDCFTECGDISKGDMFHVYFEPDRSLAAILNAPYTSYSHTLTRKSGKTADELDGLLSALSSLTGVEGSSGGAWGRAIEKDEHILLYGWDDPKVSNAQPLLHNSHMHLTPVPRRREKTRPSRVDVGQDQ